MDALFVGIDPQFLATTAQVLEVDPGRVQVVNHFGARDSILYHIVLSLADELRRWGWAGSCMSSHWQISSPSTFCVPMLCPGQSREAIFAKLCPTLVPLALAFTCQDSRQ